MTAGRSGGSAPDLRPGHAPRRGWVTGAAPLRPYLRRRFSATVGGSGSPWAPDPDPPGNGIGGTWKPSAEALGAGADPRTQADEQLLAPIGVLNAHSLGPKYYAVQPMVARPRPLTAFRALRRWDFLTHHGFKGAELCSEPPARRRGGTAEGCGMSWLALRAPCDVCDCNMSFWFGENYLRPRSFWGLGRQAALGPEARGSDPLGHFCESDLVASLLSVGLRGTQRDPELPLPPAPCDLVPATSPTELQFSLL